VDFEVTNGSTGTQHTPKLGKTSKFVPKSGRSTVRDTSSRFALDDDSHVL